MLSQTRIIHVNSRDRTSGTNENFTYTFNIGSDESYNHCCVLSASVPLSYYLIQNGLNTFTLQEGVGTVVITIPPGNYNTTSFAIILATQLNTNSPNGYTYAIALNNEFNDTNNGLFYYTVTGNGGVQPDFIVGDYMYEQLGFNSSTTVSFSADSLASTNVINFIPEQTLHIYSDLVHTSKNNCKGILQELYTSNTIPYSCVTYQCTELEAYSHRINSSKISTFSIVLQNENKDVINLNGRNMLITLLLYKKNDFTDVAKKYLQYSLKYGN